MTRSSGFPIPIPIPIRVCTPRRPSPRLCPMGAEDDIKGILGVASQVCFCGTVVAAAREAYGHWLHRTCPRCGGAARLRCEHCDASGKLQRPTKRDDFINVMEEETGTFPCMFCQGTGSVTCRTCKGAGGEIGRGLNWRRMVAGGSRPFQDLLRNRNFGLSRDAIDRAVVRRAHTDALEDFVVDDRDAAAELRRRRARARREARATRQGQDGEISRPRDRVLRITLRITVVGLRSFVRSLCNQSITPFFLSLSLSLSHSLSLSLSRPRPARVDGPSSLES